MAVFRYVFPRELLLERHAAAAPPISRAMSGAWEIEVSNGVKKFSKSGDVMLRRPNTTGEGHISRVLRQLAACLHDRALAD